MEDSSKESTPTKTTKTAQKADTVFKVTKGAESDCETLIQLFLDAPQEPGDAELSFSAFAKQWRLKKFHLIYWYILLYN